MHPTAWWDEITTDGPWNPDTDPDRNGRAYLTGELPSPTLMAVCDILRRHTATPDDCYFAVWEGWGWNSEHASAAMSSRLDVDEDTPQPPAPRVLPVRLDPNAPKLEVLHRRFLLYRGVVEQAIAIGGGEYGEGLGFFWEQSPTLMWPADHAWYLSTEIDAEYAVVGGSAAMITALTTAPDIEALAIAADAPLISTINQ